jgi:hypothetical protein
MSNTIAKISSIVRDISRSLLAGRSNMMKDTRRSLLAGGKINLVKVENTMQMKVNNTMMTRVPRSLREKRSLPKHLREERDPRLVGNMLLVTMIKRLSVLLWVQKYCKSSKNFSNRPPRHQQVVPRRNHRTSLPTSRKIIIESLNRL